jgi:glutamate formiminotransferase/formiminotetrahydrofolate cyclodeaminase
MVAALTWAKKGMEEARPTMLDLGATAQSLKQWFLENVDRDTDAFNAVLAARRLPKKSDEQQAIRDAAIERANQHATRVPLEVLGSSVRAAELALRVAREGNPASVSDAGVGGACALAAAQGAALNVRINLPSVTDTKVRDEMAAEMSRLLARAGKVDAEVRDAVDAVLNA